MSRKRKNDKYQRRKEIITTTTTTSVLTERSSFVFDSQNRKWIFICTLLLTVYKWTADPCTSCSKGGGGGGGGREREREPTTTTTEFCVN